jgi:hypothetical protein
VSLSDGKSDNSTHDVDLKGLDEALVKHFRQALAGHGGAPAGLRPELRTCLIEIIARSREGRVDAP